MNKRPTIALALLTLSLLMLVLFISHQDSESKYEQKIPEGYEINLLSYGSDSHSTALSYPTVKYSDGSRGYLYPPSTGYLQRYRDKKEAEVRERIAEYLNNMDKTDTENNDNIIEGQDTSGLPFSENSKRSYPQSETKPVIEYSLDNIKDKNKHDLIGNYVPEKTLKILTLRDLTFEGKVLDVSAGIYVARNSLDVPSSVGIYIRGGETLLMAPGSTLYVYGTLIIGDGQGWASIKSKDGTWNGIYVMTNNAKLIASNTIIDGCMYGIYGLQGSISIVNTKIYAKDIGLYYNGSETVYVTGSSLRGDRIGVEVKKGNVYIRDSVIEAKEYGVHLTQSDVGNVSQVSVSYSVIKAPTAVCAESCQSLDLSYLLLSPGRIKISRDVITSVRINNIYDAKDLQIFDNNVVSEGKETTPIAQEPNNTRYTTQKQSPTWVYPTTTRPNPNDPPDPNYVIRDFTPTFVVRPDGYITIISTSSNPPGGDPYYLDGRDGYYIYCGFEDSAGNEWRDSSRYYSNSDNALEGVHYRYPMWTFGRPYHLWGSYSNLYGSARPVGMFYYTGVYMYEKFGSITLKSWDRRAGFWLDYERPEIPNAYISGTDGPLNDGHADSITTTFYGAHDPNPGGIQRDLGLIGYNIDIYKVPNLLVNNAFESDMNNDGVPDGWYEGKYSGGDVLSYVNLDPNNGVPYNNNLPSKCIRVDPPSGTPYVFNTKLQKEVVEGKDLTFCISAKGTGEFSAMIVPMTYDNEPPSSFENDALIFEGMDHQSLTSSYQEYYGTVYVPVSTNPEISWYALFIRWDSGGTQYFDNAVLYYGDWRASTPPPFRETKKYRATELNSSTSLDLVKTHLAVYYDAYYGTGNYWVSYPNNVVTYLVNKGFTHVVAEATGSYSGYTEIDDWINARINSGDAPKSVLVILGSVPYTVCDLNTAPGIQYHSSFLDANDAANEYDPPHRMNKYPPIIEYMIKGGTIIWIGDVPFYYVTYRGGHVVWGLNGSRHLLGTYIYSRYRWWDWNIGTEGTIVSNGKVWGITVRDHAIRPIPYYECTTMLTGCWWKNNQGVYVILALSWHKNFNQRYPLSGFIRYRAEGFDGRRIDLLQDVYNLATFMQISHTGGTQYVTFTHSTSQSSMELPDNTVYMEDVAVVDRAGNISGGASWGFNHPGILGGWDIGGDIDPNSMWWLEGSVRFAVDTGGSPTGMPYATWSGNISPTSGQVILMNMRIEHQGDPRAVKAYVYWTTTGEPDFDSAKSAEATVILDNNYHVYLFNVGDNPKWYSIGNVTKLVVLPLGDIAKDNEVIWVDFITIGWRAADRTPPHVEITTTPNNPNEGQELTLTAIQNIRPSSSDLGSGIDPSGVYWDFDTTVDTSGNGVPDDDIDAVGTVVNHIYWEGGNDAGGSTTTYLLKLTVSDYAGNTNEQIVPIVVNNVNPEITSMPVVNALEDVPYTYVVTTHDIANDNPDSIIYDSIVDLRIISTTPGWVASEISTTSIDDTTWRIDWVPDQNAVDWTASNGGVDITIEVEDDDGGTDMQTFRIKVQNTNDPPNPFHLKEQPAPPSLSKPTQPYGVGNEPRVGQLRPTFRWESATDPDPTGDRVIYKLQIISSPVRLNYALPSEIHGWDSYSTLIEISNIATTEYTPDFDLQDNTWYYWRVIAIDEHGAATVSLSWDDNYCYHEFYTTFSYDLAIASITPTAVLVGQNFGGFRITLLNVGFSMFDVTRASATVFLYVDNIPEGSQTLTSNLDIGESTDVVIPYSGGSFNDVGNHKVKAVVVVTLIDPNYEQDLNPDNDVLEITLFVVRPVTIGHSIYLDPMMIIILIGLAYVLKSIHKNKNRLKK